LKILRIKDFSDVTDPVKTEHTISNQLIERQSEIDSDYAYAMIPLADIINKYGLGAAQKVISYAHSLHDPAKIFFVCQHILVRGLHFGESLVFTPHATKLDDYIAIPHYSCTYDLKEAKPWGDRKYDYSFMGDFGSHPTRLRLAQAFKDNPNTVFINTSTWHFHANQEAQKLNKKKYIELLGNTRHSLCPRGTGPSTIRMWEAMAMGSCPLIFSDSLKTPAGSELLLRFQDENSATLTGVESYDNSDYFVKFSNDKLYVGIYNAIQVGE